MDQQQIVPYLWFAGRAEEAMQFYTGLFQDGHINHIMRYPDGPLEGPMAGFEGKVLNGEFSLMGYRFYALDGGPLFQFTPAISFVVNCATADEVDRLWDALSDGGQVLMPLDEYPFSLRFSWVNDRYGVSWQLMQAPAAAQAIVPALLFVGEQNGHAEEAIRLYTGLFPDSGVDHLSHYGPDDGETEGALQQGIFHLAGQPFRAMDSGLGHDFTFNEAVSLYVSCETQDEVDRYWNALSASPENEQCGWLKDRYGVSWQIIPTALGRLMGDPDPERAGRVTHAMLGMKKLDIAELESAWAG